MAKAPAGRRRVNKDAMAKAPAARRRVGVDKDAMAKSLLVLLGLAILAAACTGQHGGRAATANAASWDDNDDTGGENLQQRQEAMKEAVKVFSGYSEATSSPEALKRAVATVNGEMVRLRPVFKAVGRMPEGRAKEEARAAAHEQLARHLSQLLPGGSVKVTKG